MIVGDASVWVSYVIPDDVHHQASRDWFDALPVTERFLEPRLLVVEIAAGVARRTNDLLAVERVVSFVLANPALDLVSMTDELVDAASELAAQLRLRAGDAVYVAAARAMGARLVTRDREQRERAAGVVEVSSPADDLLAGR